MRQPMEEVVVTWTRQGLRPRMCRSMMTNMVMSKFRYASGNPCVEVFMKNYENNYSVLLVDSAKLLDVL